MPVINQLTPETKVELLMQMSLCVQNSFDLDDVLESLLDSIRRILAYDAAGIFVLDNDEIAFPTRSQSQVIASVAMRGFEKRPVELDPMLTEGKGIIGMVIATGESVVLPDVRDNPLYVEGRAQTLSEITVPLVSNGRVIGALNLESDNPGAFDDTDLEPLRFFAEAAVISIEKALLHHQLLRSQQIENQLNTAKEVQARLLPPGAPNIPGYDIEGICIPTFAIGGDYYDYLALGEGRIGVVIADVSGDGIPAALVMSAFRALLRSQAGRVAGLQTRRIDGSKTITARKQASPSRFISRINRMLPDISGQQMFVTAIFGVLHPSRGDFLFTVCGHPPPVYSQVGRKPKLLRSDGTALGVIRKARYRTQKVEMEVGDLLVIYTDGVMELENLTGEPYGLERLLDCVEKNSEKTSKAVLAAIVDDVQAFTGLTAFPDDFTLIVLRRLEPPIDHPKGHRYQRVIDYVA